MSTCTSVNTHLEKNLWGEPKLTKKVKPLFFPCQASKVSLNILCASKGWPTNLLVCYEKAHQQQGPMASWGGATRPLLLQPQSLCWRTQACGRSKLGSTKKDRQRHFQCEVRNLPSKQQDSSPFLSSYAYQISAQSTYTPTVKGKQRWSSGRQFGELYQWTEVYSTIPFPDDCTLGTFS